MSQQTAHIPQTTQSLQLHLPLRLQNIDRTQVLSTLGKVANIVAISLLACLLLRVFLSLFLVDGFPYNAIMFVTKPLIAPFNGLVPSVTPMVQASAAVAYCVYTITYFVFLAVLRSDSVKEPAL